MKIIPPLSPRNPLVVRAILNRKTGYGYLCHHLVRGLLRRGTPVALQPLPDPMTETPPEWRPLVLGPDAQPGWEILMFPPCGLAGRGVGPRTLVFTMWESSRLDPEWVKCLNRCRAVLVPCEWNALCFSAAGVEAPIRVLPLGHDPEVFQATDEPNTRCTFGVAGAVWDAGIRKNVAETIAAFRAAFPAESDVRLRVKITAKCPLDPVDDPRVDVCRTYLEEPELAAWYRSLTALVSISSGEAFNLHLLEAMACGRPAVACRFGGPADFFDAEVGYAVDYDLVPATTYPVYSGLWCRADRESLIRNLRHVHRDHEEVVRKGRLAARRAADFTWDRTAARLAAVTEELGLLAPTRAPAAAPRWWEKVRRLLRSA